MARADNVAITARTLAIALLAPSFARAVMLGLRTVLDGPAARAGFKARAGVRGVAIRGEPGSGHGREERRRVAKIY